jgi:hypothetical protein
MTSGHHPPVIASPRLPTLKQIPRKAVYTTPLHRLRLQHVQPTDQVGPIALEFASCPIRGAVPSEYRQYC